MGLGEEQLGQLLEANLPIDAARCEASSCDRHDSGAGAVEARRGIVTENLGACSCSAADTRSWVQRALRLAHGRWALQVCLALVNHV